MFSAHTVRFVDPLIEFSYIFHFFIELLAPKETKIYRCDTLQIVSARIKLFL